MSDTIEKAEARLSDDGTLWIKTDKKTLENAQRVIIEDGKTWCKQFYAEQPQRMHGRWINEDRTVRCNQCQKGYNAVKGMRSAMTYNFCPNCGSDNREEQGNDES